MGAVIAALIAGPATAENNKSWGIDTEHLFGFLTGTDIGEVGEKEIETETTGRFSKRTGSYNALSQTLSVEYTASKNLRLELGAILGYHNISGVTGFDDLRRGNFQGVSFEMRYRLLDRQSAPFGLSILAAPRWAQIDEASGQRVQQFGGDLAILMDKELVPNRVVTAFNFQYTPEATKLRATGVWSRDATLGVSNALMAQVSPGLFVGAEARYMRAYDSLDLDRFAGHALFLGPNIFYKPSERWRVTAAWSFQVVGKAIGYSASLDLMNFERHQVKLRIGYQF